jgi:hypothetical protein
MGGIEIGSRMKIQHTLDFYDLESHLAGDCSRFIVFCDLHVPHSLERTQTKPKWNINVLDVLRFDQALIETFRT